MTGAFHEAMLFGAFRPSHPRRSLHPPRTAKRYLRNLGALNNSISITGQIAGGERRHAYKFSIPERLCVRIARKDTSVSLRAYLYDARGGLLQKERLDSARNNSKFIQQTLFPADYVLEVELFYSNDSAAIYDLVIARC
jgi:hypothetical protein